MTYILLFLFILIKLFVMLNDGRVLKY